MANESDVVNVFWTGGWDSTFRVCQLVLIENRCVQPYYVKLNVKISRFEEYIMKKMTELIRKQSLSADLLKDIIVVNKNDLLHVDHNKIIRKKFRKFSMKVGLGIQYYWLICMAKKLNIDNLEVSIERSQGSNPKLNFFLKECVKVKDVYKLKNNSELQNKEMNIFRSYSWPLFDTYKIDMMNIAKENNFFDILKLSWSCFFPKQMRNRTVPQYYVCCKKCNSCKDNEREKVGFLLNNTINLLE